MVSIPKCRDVNSQEFKAALLSSHFYDPETGDVYRTVARINAPIGKVGRASMHGKSHSYVKFTAFGKCIYTHRFAFLAMTGFWPDEYVDHINGDGLDNRWGNLRQCTNQQNQINSKQQCNSKSPFKNVYWVKRKKKWKATMRIGGRTRHIGYFLSAKEASDAYLKAAQALFGEFARAS